MAAKVEELNIRARAIEAAERSLASRVDDAVAASFASLGLETSRIEAAAKVYNDVVGAWPTSVGKAVSKKEREETDQRSSTLVYGEIHFKSWALALEKIRHKYDGLQHPGGVFVDVGSGVGKPVIAAMLLHEFSTVVGIEMLEGLHKLSLEVLDRWHEIKDDAEVSDGTRQTVVNMVNADFLEYDWSNANVVFANSTCYDSSLLKSLAEQCEKCEPGTFVITFTRRLPSDEFEVLEHERHLMSWGEATVYIHRRKEAKSAGDAAGPEEGKN